MPKNLREQYGHFEIQEHLVEKQTDSIDAYEFSLKARYYFNKWNPVDSRKAIEFFEKAISLDPKHADSYVGLADAYSFLAVTEINALRRGLEKSPGEHTTKLIAKSEHAGVHYQLANIAFFQDANFQEAFKHAIEIG